MNKEQLIQSLRTDVPSFNAYRQETDFAPIDLTRADLTDANLTDANLTDADLTRADLTDANLTDADLTDADLTRADLRGAYLTRADLRGADLDYSSLPLWCGSLRAKTDERQRKQIAYHLASLFVYSESTTDEEKAIYSALVDYANGFHRVGEVDKLKPNLN